MKRIPSTFNVLAVVAAALFYSPFALAHGGHTAESIHFAYDPAPAVIDARMTESPEFYEPSLGHLGGTDPYMAFLQYVPGKGDYLWVSPLTGGRARAPIRILPEPGCYANPTLAGNWLSYEVLPDKNGKWEIRAVELDGAGMPGREVTVRSGAGHAINHRAVAADDGSLWFTWQGENSGQYDVFAVHMAPSGEFSPAQQISKTPGGDWRPAVTVTPAGDVCVAWDAYTGESFDVLCRWFRNGEWGPVLTVAGSAAFEGRPDVATDRRGWTWITWEEGAEGWGEPFRGVEGPWNNVADTYGPLHRFRKLHVARLANDGTLLPMAQPFPMPSFAAAAAQANRRPDAPQLGAYYERAQLAVDRGDRLWITYRHFFQTQAALAEDTQHHVEYGWAIYTRCLDGDHWSMPWSYDIHQRDGMQRLDVLPQEHGLIAAWGTGRTDRRVDTVPRGVAVGIVKGDKGSPSDPAFGVPVVLAPYEPVPREAPEPAVKDSEYDIYYGDLHRHTDLSLCFPFFDGSIEDAYRYAIDVGGLDFLGITDHTRDLNHGDALAQLWWRCTKEVRRHELDGAFSPLFAFERSHGDTDHNIISLRDDMLRDYPTPLRFFWEDMGNDTFSIPHAPMNDHAWAYQDDAHRPLAEIYQGCRDYDSQEPVHKALGLGYHLGFIASSDHLSTSASYACVWAPDSTAEAIFRSMQARRTFGATSHIRLLFKTGEHWMGEIVTASTAPQFHVQVEGTGPIERIEVLHNGTVVSTFDPEGQAGFEREFVPQVELTGNDYFYIHIRQRDGNRAWSSPIWVTAPPAE